MKGRYFSSFYGFTFALNAFSFLRIRFKFKLKRHIALKIYELEEDFKNGRCKIIHASQYHRYKDFNKYLLN